MATDKTSNNSTAEGPPRKRGLWRWVLTILALAALVYVGWPYVGELHRLREVGLVGVASIGGLFLFERFLAGEIFATALHTIGHTIGRAEAFMLSILRTYAGMLIPRSGFGAVGIYLKKKWGIRYASYAALVLPITLVQFAVTGVSGLACLVVLSRYYEEPTPQLIAGTFGLAALLGTGALLVRLTVPESWPGRLAHFIRGLNEAWQKLSRNRTLLLRLVALHVTSILARAARLQTAFWGLDVSANFWGVLVASLLADLMFFISFTPQALGFREAAIVYGAQVTGATNAEALAAAVLDRLVTTVTLIVAAQICLLWMPQLRGKQMDE